MSYPLQVNSRECRAKIKYNKNRKELWQRKEKSFGMRAVRLLLYVRCGNIINAPDKRYNGMEYVAIIIGIIVGAILNEWTRQKGKP